MKNDGKLTLNRRKLLKSAGSLSLGTVVGAGMVTSLTANACDNKQQKTNYDYDAIVVGGGFAGVTAARDLQKSGYKTLVLEARNRLGGRTFTSEFAGHKIELGGSLVHWLQPEVWTEIQRYGLELMEVPLMAADKTFIKTADGKVIEAQTDDMIGILEAFNEFMQESITSWNRPYDASYTKAAIDKRDHLSVADRLNEMKLNPIQRAGLDSFLGILAAGETKDASFNEMLRIWALSNWNYPSFAGAIGQYKIKEGTKALLDAIVKDGDFEVRMSTHVKRIESKKDHAVITLQDGTSITAGAVVSALPSNVIGDIEFIPALNKGKSAIFKERNSGTNGQMFNAEIKGDIGNVSGVAASTDQLPYFGVYKQTSEHTIVNGFLTNNKLDYMDDEAIQDALREFLPGVEVISSVAYDWVNDPYSQGAYGTYKPNWIKKYSDDVYKPEGRVHFAGTDFSKGWRGFISGAIGSGTIAAQATIKMLA
ncbi:FAD-dependent oxidoreductase [Aestuariicella sp. G3-2]|uniref:flavin monoamine oxidase family protein n=1 Tax=Pseudomaricurvus albidus TaxID=2842452 RepID=UPI001C0D8A08|nr:NAD(P)/FAD-dependent oxidoreductase [Aestuariicella albida]MBU3071705.1 FAD-dependent oxidoreductase [Aestuariicella albida]